ncbi:hypothetical protein M0804_014455 [Polistes exclamans]|nr:hypothetical protein M0804_014455 [Polistes exclamans]
MPIKEQVINASKFETFVEAIGALLSVMRELGLKSISIITSDNISRPDLSVSTRIPLHLYKKLLDRVPDAKEYHMFTDKYYTSILLAEELRKMNCHLTGTIKIKRKGVLTQIKKPKFSTNKTVAYRKNNTTLLAWKDKRIITILTNYYNTQLQSTHRILRGGDVVIVNKPKMVLGYTANMGDPLQQVNASSQNAELIPHESQEAASTQNITDLEHQCQFCPRSFTTKRSLGVHKRLAHLEAANAAISVERVKKLWSPEELRLLVRVEALREEKFINEYIPSQGSGYRTLDAIKSVRHRADYKHLVGAAVRELQTVKSQEGSGSSNGNASAPPGQSLSEDRSGLPREPLDDLSTLERSSEAINSWLKSVFPPPSRRSGDSRLQVHTPFNSNDVPSWRMRRRRFARTQELFKRNPGCVAWVLDCTNESRPPNLQSMVDYWGPMMTSESTLYTLAAEKIKPMPQDLWRPVSQVEVETINVPLNSTVDIDGVTSRPWRSVTTMIRFLLFNVILAREGFSTEMLASRTIFLSKKYVAQTPADYRPISIAPVIVRQLHKILAVRLCNDGLINVRQRCLEDGCAENITVLASLLDDARRRLRELHIVFLDCAKAFDRVSHEAVKVVLHENNLPEGMINYITSTLCN